MKITKIYWFLLAFVCVAGLLIALAAYNSYSFTPGNYSTGNNAYTVSQGANMNNAKKMAAQKSPTNNVTGIVRSVDDGSITISAISPDPAATDEPKTRVILVSPDTKFVAIVAKTAAQIKADLKQFKNDQKTGKATVPPSPMREITIAPSDIKLTMMITAFADNDISNAASFNATKISFQTF
jgi:acylphosphatase